VTSPFQRQALDRSVGGVIPLVEHLCGLNAQTRRGPSVAVWTRLDPFAHEDLDQRLRSYDLVKANLMRGTVHMVTRRQYVTWRRALQPVLERVVRRSQVNRDALLREGRALLADHDGLTRADIGRMLADRFPEEEPRWLGFAVRMLVPVVQVADETVWAPGRTRYVLASAVLGEELVDAEEGLSDLLRGYLRAFGPATAADATYFTGLTRLTPSLKAVAETSGGGTQRAPLYDVDHKAFDVPEHFVLPEYDNVYFAHKSGPLEPARARLIPGKAGLMHGSLVSQHSVVASWQHRPDRDMSLVPWTELPDGATWEFRRFLDWYRDTDGNRT
jgi:Winged helix DNA-binding domain